MEAVGFVVFYDFRVRCCLLSNALPFLCFLGFRCEVAAVLGVVATPGGEAAFGASGGASGADVTTMKDEPVVRAAEERARDVPGEDLLGLEGSFGVGGEADPFGDAEDVGVDGHGGFVVDDGEDDVGGFAADALQGLEGFNGVGDAAAVCLFEAAGHGDEVAGFGAGVGDGADVFEDLVFGGGGEVGGGGIAVEEGRGHEVDPFVGALGGEDHGDEEFVGGAVVEFALDVGHVFGEPADDALVSLFEGHCVVGCFDKGRVFRGMFCAVGGVDKKGRYPDVSDTAPALFSGKRSGVLGKHGAIVAISAPFRKKMSGLLEKHGAIVVLLVPFRNKRPGLLRVRASCSQ